MGTATFQLGVYVFVVSRGRVEVDEILNDLLQSNQCTLKVSMCVGELVIFAAEEGGRA